MRLVPAMVRTGVSGAVQETRREAVSLARELGDEHLIAQAISCWNVPAPWVKSNYDPADTEFLTVIMRSLAAATLTDEERCMLLNTYAREMLYNERIPISPTKQPPMKHSISLAGSVIPN